jgi:predicted TIM-barrel fold metal-dependent hydrolase
VRRDLSAELDAGAGELPFTDTHVHFYDFARPELRWDWLRPEVDPDPNLGEFGAIRSRCYRAEDFHAETRFHHVTAVVHMQAAIGSSDPVAETAWLDATRTRVGIPQAAIGYADLAAPDVATTLERHADFPFLRGIRDLRHDDHLDDPGWRAGFAALEKLGLCYCGNPPVEDMRRFAALAEAKPGVPVCVDHAGFPLRRDFAYFRSWRDGMAALARLEHTVVKISGLGMCDHRWSVASIRPWVETCIELWGPRRAFFGTNWPVDRLFSSYGDVVDAYAEIIAPLPHPQRAALFSGNAGRFFGLADPEPSGADD